MRNGDVIGKKSSEHSGASWAEARPRARWSRDNFRQSRTFGAWTSLGHPSIAEILALSGVDFVGVDLEHSTISQEQTQYIIAAAHAAGVASLPRLASHNGEQVKRLLDAGADGVIVPMVSSRAQVDQIVAWCKYPPLGHRAYGVARAQAYGAEFEKYVAGWNAWSTIVIQIESQAGVEAIDGLVGHDEIDGAMIGPYDLSGSLGIPGQVHDQRVQDACTRVIDACRHRGKACGTHLVDPTAEDIAQAFETGYTFVILASDVFVLWKWSESMRERVASLRSEPGVRR